MALTKTKNAILIGTWFYGNKIYHISEWQSQNNLPQLDMYSSCEIIQERSCTPFKLSLIWKAQKNL